MPKLNNRYKLVKDYLRRETRLKGYPCELVIEVSNRCNLHCAICPRDRMSRAIGDMDFSLFRKIIDEIKNKTEMVDLCFAGESLLHPEIFEMIKYSKDNGIKTFLQTNVTSLNKDVSHKLINSGLDLLVLSIDSAREDTYKLIRGGDFKQVIENAENFLKIKNQDGRRLPYTIAQMISTIYNRDEVKDFMHIWKSKGADSVRIKYFNDRAGSVDRSFAGVHSERHKGFPCVRVWRGLAIFWDGRVVPCCFDFSGKYIVGDVKSESVAEIWNSAKMQELRKIHLSGIIDSIKLCRNCSGYKGNFFELIATVFIDSLTIRKLTPIWKQVRKKYDP